MPSTRPAMRISAPKAVLKKPLKISASVKTLRSAARRLAISRSSAHAACTAGPRMPISAATRTKNRAPRRNGSRRGGEPRGARLQGANAIREAAFGVLAIGVRGLRHHRFAGAVRARRMLGRGQNRVDGGAGALQHRGEAGDLRRDVIDPLA